MASVHETGQAIVTMPGYTIEWEITSAQADQIFEYLDHLLGPTPVTVHHPDGDEVLG